MLLATPKNMEKCKDIPGVVVLDLETGNSFSAGPGDRFMLLEKEEPLMSSPNTPMVLAVRASKWVDPMTGEDIIAQIPAEEN